MDSWVPSGDRSLIEAFSKLMFTRISANTTSRYYRNGLPSYIYIYTHTVLIYIYNNSTNDWKEKLSPFGIVVKIVLIKYGSN